MINNFIEKKGRNEDNNSRNGECTKGAPKNYQKYERSKWKSILNVK